MIKRYVKLDGHGKTLSISDGLMILSIELGGLIKQNQIK